MQVPSCTNVRIRSTADVHKIFYSVYLGLLPMITRRLDAKEREALSSGYCYAWEDRGPHAITGIGIERFTEGRHWSASRVRDVRLPHHSHLSISPSDPLLTLALGISILLREVGAS
jgi:Gti1/Pac2 family transcription factor